MTWKIWLGTVVVMGIVTWWAMNIAYQMGHIMAQLECIPHAS